MKIFRSLALLAALIPAAALAQSSGALPLSTVPGAMTLVGCPSPNLTPCFIPNVHSGKATYAAAFDSSGYASPTDIFSIVGSSSKTIRITRIGISGTATTATSIDVALIKRSTADTGGTPTSQTAVSYDRLDGAASATVVSYGSAPTLGTTVGEVRDAQLTLPPAASTSPALTYLNWDFGTRSGKEITLRGAADMLSFNITSGATPAGMRLSIDIEWTEE